MKSFSLDRIGAGGGGDGRAIALLDFFRSPRLAFNNAFPSNTQFSSAMVCLIYRGYSLTQFLYGCCNYRPTHTSFSHK